jgi:hypothetical protein
MTPGGGPLSRQPSCGVCAHEAHILACDWCLCADPPVPGYYPEGIE